ncbi:MAG: diguanylate cyclase [Rhodocyclales bacterium GT-UBC]|nr:MAG: diguanylate cyclase [Rhodocyclales bacterium GT-UBC]
MTPGGMDALLADSLEIGLVVLDAEARIVFTNRWFNRHGDFTADQTRGRPLLQLIPEAGDTRLEHAIEHATRHRLPSLLSPALHGTLLPLYRTPQERQSGQRMQQMIHVLPLREVRADATCLIQICDVTANISRERLLRQQSETLRRNSTQDALTGVANRRRFDEVLADEFRKARLKHSPLALLLVDLDLFSTYNTQHGRAQGDRILADTAGILRDAIRPLGDLVARYAGDKFALILPGISATETSHLAERLRRQIAGQGWPHPTSSIAPHLTVSIGAATMHPGDDGDTHTLLSSADVALYQAKHDGRNRSILFSPIDGSFMTCS